jgi:molecular chaperone HscA
MGSGVEATIEVKPSYGLADADIARMLQESGQYAKEDMQARALRELQTEANQLVDAVKNALAQDGGLLTETQRAEITAQLENLQNSLQDSDAQVLKRAITALNDATVNFAQARMDKSVASALSGKKISDLDL